MSGGLFTFRGIDRLLRTKKYYTKIHDEMDTMCSQRQAYMPKTHNELMFLYIQNPFNHADSILDNAGSNLGASEY